MERIEIPASSGAKILAVCAIVMAALSVLVLFTGRGFVQFVAFLGVMFFGLASSTCSCRFSLRGRGLPS